MRESRGILTFAPFPAVTMATNEKGRAGQARPVHFVAWFTTAIHPMGMTT